MSKVKSIIKGFKFSKKNSVAFKFTGAFLAVMMLTMVLFGASSYSEDVNKGLENNLIRLHVIANSDSPADQSLKRDVRDIIINFMKDKLKDSKNIEQTKAIINQNLANIEKLSKDEIARQGKDYGVKTMLGIYPFPIKKYGDITLPSGNYQALRVVIGKGEGANWWCVLFPPLCFVDASHGTVPNSVKKDLKKVLTKNEYKIITTADNEDDIPVKIRFKVVDFFQAAKIKFTGLISKIF